MKSQHLDKYWYILKLFTHGMHAIYRLFHKFLCMYGNKGMLDRNEYHYLVYGPRSVTKNCHILREMFKVVKLQVAWTGCTARLNNAMKAKNDAAMIFKRIIKFLDMQLWNFNVSSEYTHNGLPIKYKFM